ncbi:MAG TPA: carbohydrate kinase family protein, partial [Gemmatimonadales bacterium]|nr:carbohydrate kinase family protein [Gemmatimonadales bacterium]
GLPRPRAPLMPRVGVVGSMVWDVIHGRTPGEGDVEEWGGIAYALAAMDASLPDDWEVVPLIKVGQDRARQAAGFARGLRHWAPGARFVEVPALNNAVHLRYDQAERRCERMAGGVPGWTWPELGPMVQDLDGLYVNFISGYEMCLGTAQALRAGFSGLIYADLHSLFFGMRHDGVRVLRPLPDAPSWFGCFDVVQMNEDEMRQISDDPLALSVDVLGAGVKLLNVTLGSRGVVYVAAPGSVGHGSRVTGLGSRVTGHGSQVASPTTRDSRPTTTITTALLPPPTVETLDPTGCGDVFGAACCARLLAGDTFEQALDHANRMGARNAAFRGATALNAHLRGELVPA